VAVLQDWQIALLAVLVYAFAILALRRAGLLGPDRALSLFGPALMIKTRRGRAFLERVGRFRRAWSIIADVGLVLAGVSMILVVVVLVYDAILATHLPAALAPSPQEALGIPGLNPIIPIGYGLVALVVAVVLHEGMHGVIARSQRIGVKSLGVLWLVVPVGAFVEQDEEEVQKAPRRQRDRVAAAGILANFALALLFFALLAGLVSTSLQPNADGVGVGFVLAGTPAQNASLQAGDILTSVNGTATPTNTALFDALGRTVPHETIALTVYGPGGPSPRVAHATLAANPYDKTRGFLGIAPTFLTPAQLLSTLRSPLSSSLGPIAGFTTWLVLPVGGLEPIGGSVQSFYHLTGPFAGGDPGSFWILANLLYWLAWMNLLLGLSNSLPLVPLDGGLLFRDFAASALHRLRGSWDGARLDRVAAQLSVVASVAVVGLILWQFVAPRL
jgi:membrane-associated protease RseP (regulator of RpoE activity)